MAFAENAPDASPDKKTGITFRGKEIVLCKTRGNVPTGLTKKGIEKGILPESKKIEVVTLYAATGNIKKTAELAKLPEYTIRSWRKTEWFRDLMQEIRSENNEKLDVRFNDIIDGALEQLQDRILNGDYRLDKNGELRRVPVAAKDLSLVAAINIDKRQLLRGEPTTRSESVETEANTAVSRLEKLATTFENLAKHGRQPQTIEVEDAQLIEDASGGRDGDPIETPTEGHSEEQVPTGEV